MATLTWFDLTLVLLVAVSVASGIHRGFSRSGLGFLAVVLALGCAAWLYPADPKGFLIVFAVVVAAGGIGAFLLGRWFKSAGLTALDRLFGGAFGLANALLVWVIAVLALMAFAPELPRDYVARSRLAPYAVDAACAVAEVVPVEMRSKVEQSYQELVRVLPPKFRKPLPPLPRNEV
jgi:uncharacterized membrane protein required for colicin V production